MATIASTPTQRAYDVFNGDADGIFALHHLRLAYPLDTVLITGAKRDISLLERVPAGQASDISVLDISLDVNVAALKQLLDTGSRVSYFDHHAAQQAFDHPNLRLFWDESPTVCTSLLVDQHVQGQFHTWAITASFGDNLETVAQTLALKAGLSTQQTDALQRLGTVLNYNAYGETVADLHIAPDALYRALHPYVDPFDFIANSAQYRILSDGYQSDEQSMVSLKPQWSASCGDIYVLPNAPWARRISGIFANQLVSEKPDKSFAVLTEQSNGCYSVSVRTGTPMTTPAHRFCETFATGGGRKGAGGINRLPADETEQFSTRFFDYFSAA